MKTGMLALAISVASTCYAGPNKEQFELQERCGKLTRDAFEREWGHDGIVNNKDNQMWASYQNHYNTKLNKCFYLQSVRTIPKNKKGSVTEEQQLYDINENKDYGNLYVILNRDGQDGTTFCNLLQKGCQSRAEWESLIRPYMED